MLCNVKLEQGIKNSDDKLYVRNSARYYINIKLTKYDIINIVIYIII